MIETLLKIVIKWLEIWLNRQSLKTFGAVRDRRWRGVRTKHLERNPLCALCGSDETLEVHHINPFHSHPELELDPNNLITLCESGKNGIVCHRAFGHLGNYQSVNKNVIQDVLIWKLKIQNRP